jgi:hypothetical protein
MFLDRLLGKQIIILGYSYLCYCRVELLILLLQISTIISSYCHKTYYGLPVSSLPQVAQKYIANIQNIPKSIHCSLLLLHVGVVQKFNISATQS